MLCMRWNNQFGCIYIDGSHLKVTFSHLWTCLDSAKSSVSITDLFFVQHDLQLGDEVYVDGHAPPLRLYEPRTV
jgi:hypothetical protein